MKTIIQKFIAAVTGNALVHGFIMAVLGAVGSIVYPVINQMANSQPYEFPTWQKIVAAGLGAGMIYIFKNTLFGSSGDQAAITPPKV